MRPSGTLSVLLLIALLALPSAGKKKQGTPLQQRPGESVELPDFTPVIAAQKCESWAWAAGLETLLRAQSVHLDQRYWLTKLLGGELCQSDFGKLDDLARVINGEYILDDGHKVRLEARYVVGAPTAVDDMIAAVRSGRSALFFWKGHPYLLWGVVYDEYIAPNGHRSFEVRQIKLRDLYFAQGDQRFVTFVRGTDNPADIDGMLQVSVTVITQQPWIR